MGKNNVLMNELSYLFRGSFTDVKNASSVPKYETSPYMEYVLTIIVLIITR
jgi:hypothetical protein